MPLAEEYRENIESQVADMRQTGGKYGSAINAAKVLEHFVDDAAWAHLDIAGLEFAESHSHFLQNGATGFGARALAEFVLRQAEHEFYA
jgi:leucyl aminopeptidase